VLGHEIGRPQTSPIPLTWGPSTGADAGRKQEDPVVSFAAEHRLMIIAKV
jgi:hypothetical protein